MTRVATIKQMFLGRLCDMVVTADTWIDLAAEVASRTPDTANECINLLMAEYAAEGEVE